MEKLDREMILVALSSLNRKLEARSIIGEVCIFGGATMVLAFHARLSTRDLDAVFQPAQTVREAASEVAAELGLNDGWINDGVKGWLSPPRRGHAGKPADLRPPPADPAHDEISPRDEVPRGSGAGSRDRRRPSR